MMSVIGVIRYGNTEGIAQQAERERYSDEDDDEYAKTERIM